MPDEDSRPRPVEGRDAFGKPIIDPTKNVLDLVEAAIRRQDDLRAEAVKLAASELARTEDVAAANIASIRRELAASEASRVEQKVDTATAVSAALSAAEKAVREQALASKEAILKSETGVAEQSRLNAATFKSDLAAVIQSLQDVKDRVGRMENIKQGGEDRRTDTRLNIGTIVGILGAVVAVLMLAAVIAIAVLRG